MRGLLLKELLNLKAISGSLIGILLFYLFFLLTGNDVSFMSFFCVLVVVMMSVSTFGVDEKAKWDRYALTFPISRNELVASKYLLALILEGGALIGGIALSSISSWVMGYSRLTVSEWALSWGAVGVAGMVMTSIIFPLIYCFGLEKARFYMMAIFLVPAAILFLVNQMGIPIPLPTAETLHMLFYLVPVAALGLLYGSYCLSCKIYRKREF